MANKKNIIRQIFVFILFLIFASFISTLLYRVIQKDWIIYREAEKKFKSEHYESAVKNLLLLLDKKFDQTLVIEKLLESYIRLDQKSNAKEILTAFLNQNEYKEYDKLADLCMRVGMFEESVKLYQNIVSSEPNNRRIRISFARALTASGRFEEAINEYRKILGEKL